jgi:DNA replication protein DnaC
MSDAAQSPFDAALLRVPTPEQAARNRAEYDARKATEAIQERATREAQFNDSCPRLYRTTDLSRTPHNHAYKPTPGMPQIDWEAFNRVQAWQFNEEGRGLVLAGPTGLGKTRAIWHLLRRLVVEENKRVETYTATKFGIKAEQMMELGRGLTAEWTTSLASPHVLFIDDLGQMKMIASRHEWLSSLIFDFVETRMAEGRPMFFTTNLSQPELCAYTGKDRGEPFLRRIMECCELITFKAPDAAEPSDPKPRIPAVPSERNNHTTIKE